MSLQIPAGKAARVNKILPLESASGWTRSRGELQAGSTKLTAKHSFISAETRVPLSHSQLFVLQVQGERNAKKILCFTTVADNSILWQDPAYGMDHQINYSAFGGPEALVKGHTQAL